MANNTEDLIPQAVDPAARRKQPQSSNLNATSAAPLEIEIPSQHIERPVSANSSVIKSDISYEIKGEASQFLELKLRPAQSVVGEISALMYYENGINMKMRANISGGEDLGFFAKLLGIGKAAASGHKLFMMTFTNTTQKELKIAFSMPYPGTIVPIDLNSIGYKLICQDSSFLCATSDLKIKPASSSDLGASVLNTVISMQRIEGRGTVFLFCGGSVMQRNLVPGDIINVTTGTALAFQPGIAFKVKTIRNVGITGQGHMLTEISGAGQVWLQSLPFKRINDSIIDNVATFFGIKPKKKNPVWGKK